METTESRKFLKRFPDTEAIVKHIVNSRGIDYDNEDIFTWEIRSVKLPDQDSHIGTTTVYKLWINNEFVINVSPMTPKLLKMIDELYPNSLPKDQAAEPGSVNQ